VKGWDDLTKNNLEVIEPNPFTSGGAKWNIMAAYGAQLEEGKTEAQAKDYLTKLFDHVPVLDKSAREALQTFTSGKGDVLLSYENEAILAQQQGEDIEYVVPDQTILIQNPVAVDNESGNAAKAKAFVDFLYTPTAQEIFASKGYRPVVQGTKTTEHFPTPPNLFEISKFGGWGTVNDTFFDPEKGVIADIFKSQGKSTASG
jgi:sulfate/thiosulfate transport system substrate-binding protein